MGQYNLSLRNYEKAVEAIDCKRYYRALSRQCTDEWFELRYGRITGTRAKYLISGEFEKLYEVIHEEGSSSNFDPQQLYRVEFGLRNEPIARENLSKELGVEIIEWGLLISKEYPRLAVSLDGYIPSINATVEIKCPQRIVNGYKHLVGVDNPDFEKFLPYNYYTQVQLGLLITGAKFCYFYVYAPTVGEHLLLKIPPDPKYHKRLITAYNKFMKWMSTRKT